MENFITHYYLILQYIVKTNQVHCWFTPSWLKLDNNKGQLHQVLLEILHESSCNAIQFTSRNTGVFARTSRTKRRTFSGTKNRTYLFRLSSCSYEDSPHKRRPEPISQHCDVTFDTNLTARDSIKKA